MPAPEVVTATPAGFWRTVGLLLRSARRRSIQRQKRQQELMQYRARRKPRFNLAGLGFIFIVLLMAGLNCLAAVLVYFAVTAGERLQAEKGGKMVVSNWLIDDLRKSERRYGHDPEAVLAYDRSLGSLIYSEASSISLEYGGKTSAVQEQIRQTYRAHGIDGFVSRSEAAPGLQALPRSGAIPAMMGSLILIWWCVMVTFQGEGLELDLQRRRHPMWEWLLSHPVTPGAVFMAEMLSPIAANPIYCTAPAFAGLLYGFVYGLWPGVAATFLIGVPVAIATACLGKALEIGCVLRFAPRTRGAMIGLMSWLGYASMMLFMVGTFSAMKMAEPIGRFLSPLVVIPWPWLGLFLGQYNGVYSFPLGVFLCWCASAAAITVAVAFSGWAAQQGLAGNFGRSDAAPSARTKPGVQFGRDPLYRKEMLWFLRDRSAIVQTILIPFTVAGFQLFNMRNALAAAEGAWNYLCGAAILFGTYFLWILGPKSLASEGNALWIALTWPRGLESLLKAKAWLWSLVSSGIVALILIYAIFLYPEAAWKILLVGVGWHFFGRSMAEKTVTLVRKPTESGEPEKISRSRQWGASLGMLTFATGVLTQQWHIAIMGIVYSYITAAAMWENFRARLPYLYDPWSEKLPPPPTLMHAMIAISSLIESAAVLTGCTLAVVGRANLAPYQVMIYGVCALIVSLILIWFLANRGVALKDIWCWNPPADAVATQKPWWCGDGSRGGRFFLALLGGATGGIVLGLFAHLYLAAMAHVPVLARLLEQSQGQLAKYPDLRTSYAFIAIAFAPFAEEFLFRGLLFRALDREWGGWRAILGSAAFFAIYHPLLSWLPVGLLGAANALIFKKTGRLAPAVILHMVYNTVVVLG
jgi:membrane protease YdiL (CAAX protease family)